MSKSNCQEMKQTVGPIFEFGRYVCHSAETALNQEDRLSRTALPKMGNAIGRLQFRVIREIEKQPLGGLVAPALEAVVASQAVMLNVAVHAQDFAIRSSAKVAGECADAFDAKLKKLQDGPKDG